MAVDYYKVLQELYCGITTIGRSESSAATLKKRLGSKIITGGIENFFSKTIKRLMRLLLLLA